MRLTNRQSRGGDWSRGLDPPRGDQPVRSEGAARLRMSSEGRDVVRLRSSQWPAGSSPARAPESPPLHAYVLDADDELAEELDLRERFTARQHATARVLEAEPGGCDLQPWLAAVGHGPGILILDGLLAGDT